MHIDLSHITKSFKNETGHVEVFKDLNLKISDGEFVSLIGPNGCGKTTLLNLIDGLDQDFEGKRAVTIHYKDAANAFSYMFQKDLLLPWNTVFENILVGVEIKGQVNSKTVDMAHSLLSDFGISKLRDTYPNRLSGGERQKVALIRTFLIESSATLLDEPFSSIDYNSRLELQIKVSQFSQAFKRTTILVTHDIDEAITLSDRVLILGKKPNGIIKDLKIDIDRADRSPSKLRQHHLYPGYFNTIWQLIKTNNEA